MATMIRKTEECSIENSDTSSEAGRQAKCRKILSMFSNFDHYISDKSKNYQCCRMRK